MIPICKLACFITKCVFNKHKIFIFIMIQMIWIIYNLLHSTHFLKVFYSKISEKHGNKKNKLLLWVSDTQNKPQIQILSFINQKRSLFLNLPEMKIKTLSALSETELWSNRKWPYKALFLKGRNENRSFSKFRAAVCVYRHWGWTRQHLWLWRKKKTKEKKTQPHTISQNPHRKMISVQRLYIYI